LQPQKAGEPDILSLFYEKPEITIHDIISKYSVSRTTAQRWLQALLDQNKIIREGQTRNVRYRRI
jgi:predicted transcriptional regulator